MNIKEILRRLDFGKAFQRWPIASAISVAISTILLIWIYQENLSDQANSTFLRTVLSLYVGFLLAIITPLALKKNLPKANSLLITAISAASIGALWYLILPNDITAPNYETYCLGYAYPMQIAILHLLISIAAFWKRDANEILFRNWNIQLLRIVFEGLLFVAVLMMGLSLALLALEHLFGFDIDEKPYLYLIVLLLGLFHPWFVLSKTSHTSDSLASESNIAGFRILTHYVLIPIVILYMLILYIYGVKILMEGGLPEGWLGKLSLGFCSVSLLTFVLNSQLKEYSDKKISHLFHRWIPLVLIIPISLLCIAIARRIQDYGVTENRYLLAGIAIWLMFIALIYSFKKQLSIKWIPISLTALLIIQLLSGPFNIFNSTIRSQEKRLALELEEAGLLKDGVLIKRESQDSNFIDLSSLRFLSDRIQLKRLSYFNSAEISWSDLEHGNNQLTYITNLLRIHEDQKTIGYENIYFQAQRSQKIGISSYDYAIPFSTFYFSASDKIQINSSKVKLVITLENNITHEIDVSEIYEKHKLKKEDKKQLPLVFDSNPLYTLYLSEYNIEFSGQNPTLNSCSGILFYSSKE